MSQYTRYRETGKKRARNRNCAHWSSAYYGVLLYLPNQFFVLYDCFHVHLYIISWSGVFICCRKQSVLDMVIFNLKWRSTLASHMLGYICETVNVNDGHFTPRNLFGILLNQPEIRLYIPFSDWFSINPFSHSPNILIGGW